MPYEVLPRASTSRLNQHSPEDREESDDDDDEVVAGGLVFGSVSEDGHVKSGSLWSHWYDDVTTMTSVMLFGVKEDE